MKRLRHIVSFTESSGKLDISLRRLRAFSGVRVVFGFLAYFKTESNPASSRSLDLFPFLTILDQPKRLKLIHHLKFFLKPQILVSYNHQQVLKSWRYRKQVDRWPQLSVVLWNV